MKLLLPFKPKMAFTIITSLSLITTSNLMASSCTKADIDYYLQRGFTHAQVTRLCSINTQAPGQTYIAPPAASSSFPVASSSQPSSLTEDKVYFETVLGTKSAQLTPSSLSYTSNECVKYGETNLAGLREKACVNSRITINFKGLQVVKAVKGIFLLRDQEMLISGDIQREYLNINSLKPGHQAVVRAQLPTNPKMLDLPVIKGIDPQLVANRLTRYITQ